MEKKVKGKSLDLDKSKVTKSGNLVLKGKGVFSGKHHYTAYLEDSVLKYGSEKKKVITEMIDLSAVMAVEKDEEDHHRFNIFSSSKEKAKFRADSTPERDSWVSALKSAAQKLYEEKVLKIEEEQKKEGKDFRQIFELYEKEEESSKSDEKDDPPGRHILPYLKDPKIKYSVWTVLKDSIGKDLTKISLPVYFNHPLNTHQRVAATCENNNLLDGAIAQQDSLRRLAYIACYYISSYGHYEKGSQKPFNPLQHETYELKTKDYQFLGEQVSHHPPIVAYDIKGKAGYHRYGMSRPKKPKFNGNSITCSQYYKEYMELEPHGEKYQIEMAPFTINGLIFGVPFIDVQDNCIIENLNKKGEHAVLTFHPRQKDESKFFSVDGEVFNDKKEVVYKIHGKWSEGASITDVATGTTEQIWKKSPYPENWEFQYGMSYYMIQLNYLPNYLKDKLAPTDTRLRPDQQRLEIGDMKGAIQEKERLENKQRTVRKYHEKHNITPPLLYFEEYKNPLDNDEVYYKYNGLYFEKDRKERNWSRLPDIYSDKLPEEIEQSLKKK